MQKVRGAFAIAAVVGLVAACSAGGSESGTEETRMQVAGYLGPGSIAGKGLQEWADAIGEATGGSIEIEIHPSGSLLPPTEILHGVSDGRAEIGMTSYGYYPAELPLSHVINLPFVTENIPAQEATFNELATSSDVFREEYEKQGLKLLYTQVVPPTMLGCREPVESISDLKGRTVRAAGLVSEAFEAVGANVSALAVTELRDAVAKGVVDCWSTLSLDIGVELGLHTETPHIYDFGYGNYGTSSVFISQSVWDGLSDAQQKAFEEESAAMPERNSSLATEILTAACKTAVDDGATVGRLPDDLVAEWRDAVGSRIHDKFIGMSPAAEGFLEEYEDVLEEQEANFSDFTPPLAACTGS